MILAVPALWRAVGWVIRPLREWQGRGLTTALLGGRQLGLEEGITDLYLTAHNNTIIYLVPML